MQQTTANTSAETLATPLLLAIILIEGFITIAVEILTIRQLIPVVGNSVIVTSIIIGVFLLFLAYGYRRGGQHQQNLAKILKTNFTIAAILLGIGLAYPFVLIFFTSLQHFFQLKLLIILTMYLLAITAPLVYFLGQTVPITMNLFASDARAGAIGGNVLHLSTIGSFLGAVLTSLLLLNYFGVAATIICAFGLLIVLILILGVNWRQDWQRLIILAATAFLTYEFNHDFEAKSFVLTNSYANYAVLPEIANIYHKTGALLNINSAPSSFLTANNEAFPYIELIKKILFQDLNLRQQQILILGAGGFTITAAGTHDNKVTYVDIDADIKKAVIPKFIPAINGDFINADARVFLRQHQHQYAAIVIDTFNSRFSIPDHLITQDFMQNVKQALLPDGVAIFNVVASPTFQQHYSARVNNTIQAVFHKCSVTPIKYTATPTNLIYFCSNNASKDAKIYTDNINSATTDYFNMVE